MFHFILQICCLKHLFYLILFWFFFWHFSTSPNFTVKHLFYLILFWFFFWHFPKSPNFTVLLFISSKISIGLPRTLISVYYLFFTCVYSNLAFLRIWKSFSLPLALKLSVICLFLYHSIALLCFSLWFSIIFASFQLTFLLENK